MNAWMLQGKVVIPVIYKERSKLVRANSAPE